MVILYIGHVNVDTVPKQTPEHVSVAAAACFDELFVRRRTAAPRTLYEMDIARAATRTVCVLRSRLAIELWPRCTASSSGVFSFFYVHWIG